MLSVYTIKGVYLPNGDNPTWRLGGVDGAINYVERNFRSLTHYGENIEIYEGKTLVAVQNWIEDSDGEYKPSEWVKIDY